MSSRHRILIIEDDVELAKSYAYLISTECKVDVIFQVDPRSAAQALHNEQYDVVIIDLRLGSNTEGEFEGMEIARAALKSDPLRPVIIVTGYASFALARSAFSEGVLDFIQKGIDTATDLVAACHKALEHRRFQLLRLTNPFSPAGGPPSKLFDGRESELRFLEERLQRTIKGIGPEHFALLGRAGIGKTALLKEFKNTCQLKGCAVAMISAPPIGEKSGSIELAIALIDLIKRSMPFPASIFSRLNQHIDSAKNRHTGIESNIPLPARDRFSALAFLVDSYESLAVDLRGKADQLIIVIDDVDQWFDHPEMMILLQRSLQMDQVAKTRIIFGFAANESRWNDARGIENKTTILRTIGFRRLIGNINERSLESIIRNALRGAGVAFEDDVIKNVIKWSDGHPGMAQTVCYHLYDNQFLGKVGMDVWNKALECALQDLSHYGIDP